jgi:hypothetical protein
VAAILTLSATAGAQGGVELSPEKRAEARQHYENGLRKYDLAKYDEAAAEFQAAYEVSGRPEILYNIAQSYRLGEKHEKALFFYKTFLRRMGDKAKPELKAEIDRHIDELNKAVAEAKHASTSPPTGTIPSGDLTGPVTPPPKPAESRPPPKPVETAMTTKPRETTPPPSETRPPETTTAPPPAETTTTTTETPPPTETTHPSGNKTMKIVGFSLIGLAVVSAGVGIGMSVGAGKDSDSLTNASTNHNTFGPNLQSAESNGQLYDTLSYVFYGVAGAAAIGGAVTLYLGFRKPAAARAQLTPTIGGKLAGLSLRGSF